MKFFGVFKEGIRKTSVTALALAVTLASIPSPAFGTVTGTGTATTTSVIAPPPQNGQAGAQQNAGNSNNMAAMLGKAAGVLSMASGGLYMAKGADELKCCVQGCTNNSGNNAVQEKARQDTTNIMNADCVKNPTACHPMRQPVDYFRLRFPDGAQNSCPAIRFRAPFPLLDLFRPAPAQANGCIDGMLALATGGLMMLNGMLGLMAANQAGQNGATAMNNAGNMGAYPTADGGTSPTGTSSGTTSSKLGDGSGTSSQIKLDPALLRTGTANNIMGQFEKKFGIARDSFAQDVIGGTDPRKLLATAPMNPLSVSDMNKAMNAAKNMSDEDKAKALAGTQLAAAQNELSNQMDGRGVASTPAGHSVYKDDGELEPLSALGSATTTSTQALDDLNVSPEVKAALLAQQLEDSKKNDMNMDLFQIVHRKYREKSKMIFGYDPDAGGGLKGVGDANGN